MQQDNHVVLERLSSQSEKNNKNKNNLCTIEMYNFTI